MDTEYNLEEAIDLAIEAGLEEVEVFERDEYTGQKELRVVYSGDVYQIAELIRIARRAADRSSADYWKAEHLAGNKKIEELEEAVANAKKLKLYASQHQPGCSVHDGDPCDCYFK